MKVDIKKIFCEICGLTFYKNVAAASACIIEDEGKILFVIRNKNPQKGYYDLPGGFIDPGEDAETGIIRECFEELSIKPVDLKYMHSFPNIYEYKGIVYNTCDMVFTAKTGDIKKADLKIDMKEIKDVVYIDKKNIDFEKIAFPSIKKALKMFTEKN